MFWVAWAQGRRHRLRALQGERGFWPPAPPFPTGFRAVLAWPAGGEEPLQMAGREPPKNQPAPCRSIPLTSKALASRR